MSGTRKVQENFQLPNAGWRLTKASGDPWVWLAGRIIDPNKLSLEIEGTPRELGEALPRVTGYHHGAHVATAI
jgi:hypothetical protein